MSAEWTAEPKKCFFCPQLDNGYSLADNQGVWQPACWECVKKSLKKKENKECQTTTT
jgi:hypothetical protein